MRIARWNPARRRERPSLSLEFAEAPRTPFEAFVEPARRHPQLWRLILGLAIVVACWLFSSFVVIAVGVAPVFLTRPPDPDALTQRLDAMMAGVNRSDVALLLVSFVGIWVGLFAVVKLLHGRPFATLFGPDRRIRWNEFAQGVAFIGVIFLIGLAVAAATSGLPQPSGQPLAPWLAWLIPMAVVTFLQTTAEELLFRGYLIQQLAARFRSPLIWAGLPAILFAAGHYSNPQVAGAGIFYVGSTLLYALTATVLTARTGSLSAAMGMHFANNLLFFAGTGVQGEGAGASLFTYAPPTDVWFYAWDWIPSGLMLLFVLSPFNRIGRRPPTVVAGS